MIDGTHTDLSPWSSGTWKFDPRQIGLTSPKKARKKTTQNIEIGHGEYVSERNQTRKFGSLPEAELLRLGSIVLFAASGFALAIIGIILLA